ncbi:MAG: hypothetical protein M1483_02420 [Actinobacteria bacterium]|nr:hypothetical protein [Actinomycetota bacterium]MCL6104480.1 hypothetical protein [Actinomycetota bacterium]
MPQPYAEFPTAYVCSSPRRRAANKDFWGTSGHGRGGGTVSFRTELSHGNHPRHALFTVKGACNVFLAVGKRVASHIGMQLACISAPAQVSSHILLRCFSSSITALMPFRTSWIE